MSRFRLIGIRTGDQPPEWQDNFLKRLQPNTFFPFFSCFELSENQKHLLYKPERDAQNLYKLENNPAVSVAISAIVGKNGSGKSTLLELLYLAIYNLSVARGLLRGSKPITLLGQEEQEEQEEPLNCDLFFESSGPRSGYHMLRFAEHTSAYFKLRKVAQIPDTFYWPKQGKPFYEFELEEFFYSVVVNYSIYGLNSNHIGEWINELFHKNDAYQTPIVINPMRTEGNFDVNTDEYLTRARLIASSMLKLGKTRKPILINENQHIERLVFRLNKKKIELLEQASSMEADGLAGGKITSRKRRIDEFISESGFESAGEIVRMVIQAFNGAPADYSAVRFAKEVELYIVKKLYRIAFTYRRYNRHLRPPTLIPKKFSSVFEEVWLRVYLEELKNDETHVTFKLRQAINYLLYNPLAETDGLEWKLLDKDEPIFGISLDQLTERILAQPDKPINCIPPSLFSCEILLGNPDNSSLSPLEQMSSGELQLVNATQSALYNLINLDSYDKQRVLDHEIIYRNALIVFDEVELYFHPEYQRRLLKYLLRELDSLGLSLVTNIHILFVTHSPFILSDIPHTNLLRLVAGAPDEAEAESPTFAGNIHELLRSSFFLEASTGEYSVEVINKLLKDLRDIMELKAGKWDDKSLVFPPSIEDKITMLKTSNKLRLIQSVGDGLVRDKLESMYWQCVLDDKEARKKQIAEQIGRLEGEMRNLDSEQDD
jgi:energy-coupling factor transporter ATP-binding protein EcfA2